MSISVHPFSITDAKQISGLARTMAQDLKSNPKQSLIDRMSHWIRGRLADPVTVAAYVVIADTQPIGALWLQSSSMPNSQAESKSIEFIVYYLAMKHKRASAQAYQHADCLAQILVAEYADTIDGGVLVAGLTVLQDAPVTAHFYERLAQGGGIVCNRRRQVLSTQAIAVPKAIETPELALTSLDRAELTELLEVGREAHLAMQDIPYLRGYDKYEVFAGTFDVLFGERPTYHLLEQASFTARWNGAAAGAVMMTRHVDKESAVLYEIFVGPNFQNKQVGTHLLEHALYAVKTYYPQISQVQLVVSCHVPTLNYYPKFGFKNDKDYWLLGFPGCPQSVDSSMRSSSD